MLASLAAGAASVPHLLLWKALARCSPPDSVRCAFTCTHTHAHTHTPSMSAIRAFDSTTKLCTCVRVCVVVFVAVIHCNRVGVFQVLLTAAHAHCGSALGPRCFALDPFEACGPLTVANVHQVTGMLSPVQ